MEEKMITITQDEYDQLKEDSEFLECLRACGVDNWMGYGEAKVMMDEDEEEDDA